VHRTTGLHISASTLTHPEAGPQAQHQVALLRGLYGARMVSLGQWVLPVQAVVLQRTAALAPAPRALEPNLRYQCPAHQPPNSTAASCSVTGAQHSNALGTSMSLCILPHRVELKLANILPPALAAAALLHEAGAVQLGEPLALDA
jgi:hypothetical protein